MNRHLLIFGIAILLIIVGLSGCLSDEEKGFIGSWQGNDVFKTVYTFKEGLFSKPLEVTAGSGFGAGSTGTGDWRIEDNKLYISVNLDIKTTFTYNFRFEGNDILILTPLGGTEGMTLTRI